MQQLINALEEVEQYHQIDSSLQIKQFLSEARDILKQMIRVVNIKDDLLATLSVVTDFSYA
jgi:WASH complex subunit strumpellin